MDGGPGPTNRFVFMVFADRKQAEMRGAIECAKGAIAYHVDDYPVTDGYVD
jgi:hypothetical protein